MSTHYYVLLCNVKTSSGTMTNDSTAIFLAEFDGPFDSNFTGFFGRLRSHGGHG